MGETFAEVARVEARASEGVLDEVDAPESLRTQWAEMKEKRWRESYTKHPKTFVRVGQPQSDRSATEPVGMFLEIVPEKDPTALKAGDEFTVRVMKDGQPVRRLLHQRGER